MAAEMTNEEKGYLIGTGIGIIILLVITYYVLASKLHAGLKLVLAIILFSSMYGAYYSYLVKTGKVTVTS